MRTIITKIIVVILLLLFQRNILSANSIMKIVLNGHEYSVENIFDKRMQEIYDRNKSIIRTKIEDEIRQQQSDIDQLDITLPASVNIIYTFDDLLSQSRLEASLENIDIWFNFKGHDDCSQDVNFNLKIVYDIQMSIDSLGIWLTFLAEDPEVYDLDVNTHSPSWLEDWRDYFFCQGKKISEWGIEWLNTNFGYIDRIIEDEISKELVDTSFAILRFSKFKYGDLIDPDELIALENSFPLNGSLAVTDNKELVIKINFLEGENGEFKNINPDPVPANHQLELGGFSFLYHNLEEGFSWQNGSGWDVYRRIDEAFNKMESLGITGCRVEARWRDFQPSSQVVLGKSPQEVTDTEIDNLINNGAVGWSIMDYILDKALEKGIIVFVAVGVGHQDRPPGTLTFPDARLAPHLGGPLPPGYIAVTANDYLYNLKLYSHAVMRRYANRVPVWQIENELNAARFAESFNWWRKGNLWEDDQPGGFQDQVWQVLVNAVRTEDPRSKILHDFHMLDIEDRLRRWGKDLDIIGVNFYPNMLFAYPVLGFSVGEYVWAIRRMLKGLGMADKPVWVTETGYPALTSVATPDPYSVDKDVMHYSEQRQQQYIEDALNSSVENGAAGFFYFSLTTEENEGSQNSPLLNRYLRYSGLIRPDVFNNYKIALQPFATLYKASYPGIGQVRLWNRYNSENIGGQVSLKGYMDFLNSGSYSWIVKKTSYIARTELEKTTYSGSVIKHHDWDGLGSKWKMDYKDFTLQEDLEDHNANFIPLKKISIHTDFIGIGRDLGNLFFKDPWHVELDGSQPDTFKLYTTPFTPGTGNYEYYKGVFLNQGYSQGQWQPPYYSVRAPQQQIIPFHGQDITWYFQGWEADTDSVAFQNPDLDSTAVVFKKDGAVVRAMYKGHLVSNKSNATSFNSARHIVVGSDSKYKWVYRDAGSIYFTSSSDGISWDKEIKISGDLDNCEQPIIAAGLRSGYLYVVWQRKIGTRKYELWFTRSTDNGVSWSAPAILPGTDNLTVHPYQKYGPMPVVAEMRKEKFSPFSTQIGILASPPEYDYKTIVVYVEESGLKWQSSLNGGQSWSGVLNLPVESALTVWSPSLTSGTDFLALAYSFRTNFEVKTRIYDGVSWSNAVDVSGVAGLDYDRLPSITVDRGGNLYVAWRGHPNGVGIYQIVIRKGNADNTWNNWVRIIPDNNLSTGGPSISFKNYDDIVVSYFTSDYSVRVRQYDSNLSNWTETVVSSNGANVNNAGLLRSDYMDPLTIWTELTGAPYLLKTDAGVNYQTSSTLASNEVFLREAVAYNQTDGSYLGLEFGDVGLVSGSSKRMFSLPALNYLKKLSADSASIWDYLRSRDILLPDNARKLTFNARLYVSNGRSDSLENRVSGSTFKDVAAWVYLLEAWTGKLLQKFPLTGKNHSYSIDVSRYGAKRIFVKPLVVFKKVGVGKLTYGLGNIQRSSEGRNPSLAVKETAPPEETLLQEREIPQQFILNPNYPNPFNPETTIEFGLPQAVHVLLVIYDVQGRVVRHLLNDYRQAGWQQIRWDGRDDTGKAVASGVYIYRLQAGEFVASRKMLLVR